MKYKAILISGDNHSTVLRLADKIKTELCVDITKCHYRTEGNASDAQNTISLIEKDAELNLIILADDLLSIYLEMLTEIKVDVMSFYVYKKPTYYAGGAYTKSKGNIPERNVTYWIEQTPVDTHMVSLISKLWEVRGIGGGLSRDIIEKMINCGILFQEASISNISNSSYDLTLGDEYYYGGEIKSLSRNSPGLSIEPYDYVIASCREYVSMPRDVSGRFDLIVDLFCQGLILSNSTQVDPGFHGKLFCLLFNTSNKVVNIKRGSKLATFDFNKLVEPTTPYDGRYNYEDSIECYLPDNVLSGAINELKREMEALKKESLKMQEIYFSVMALLFAFISVIVAINF